MCKKWVLAIIMCRVLLWGRVSHWGMCYHFPHWTDEGIVWWLNDRLRVEWQHGSLMFMPLFRVSCNVWCIVNKKNLYLAECLDNPWPLTQISPPWIHSLETSSSWYFTTCKKPLCLGVGVGSDFCPQLVSLSVTAHHHSSARRVSSACPSAAHLPCPFLKERK